MRFRGCNCGVGLSNAGRDHDIKTAGGEVFNVRCVGTVSSTTPTSKARLIQKESAAAQEEACGKGDVLGEAPWFVD